MPKRDLVMIPLRPNSMIMERDSTKGGDTTGSMDTSANSFSRIFVLSFTYTST